MTKSYYEAHVTMLSGSSSGPGTLKRITTDAGWKFSAIAGDINLGDGTKYYATRQFNKRLGDDAAIKALHEMADHLKKWGADIQRRKVEVVIYDDRSALVKPCDGGCVECHLDDLPEAGKLQVTFDNTPEWVRGKSLADDVKHGRVTMDDLLYGPDKVFIQPHIEEEVVFLPITSRATYAGRHYVVVEKKGNHYLDLYCDDEFVATYPIYANLPTIIKAHAINAEKSNEHARTRTRTTSTVDGAAPGGLGSYQG